MINNVLETNFVGITMANPLMTASGCFGFGLEYKDYFDPNELGGIVVKGLTLEQRDGNSGIRIAETPSGMLNSVGLENPWIEYFENVIVNEIKKNINVPIIANINGRTVEEYIELASRIENIDEVHGIELNISCPNVKEGGIAFGITCEGAEKVVREVRKVLTVPMAVKLSPNAENIVNVAKTCEYEGADGISLINTFSALKIDIKKRRPVFDNVYAGLSGPVIKPIALKMVREVAKAVKVPVIGMGGITTAEDAIEFIMAGAHLIQFGTASFINPYAGKDIVEGIEAFMKEENIKSLDEIRGII